MKKWFEKQEEHIDEKFKDISVTMEKNQESLLTAFQTKKSEQGQINSLSKRQKADDNPSEGVKRACKDTSDLDNKYMDKLEEPIIKTQPA
eukprot:2499481-Ditylum_brightwellii.AAC.1